jgi:hypothetical protein
MGGSADPASLDTLTTIVHRALFDGQGDSPGNGRRAAGSKTQHAR